MTPLEINKLIAESKGIKTAIINGEIHSLYDDGSRHEFIDYTTDWGLCGPLMDELLQKRWEPIYLPSFKKYSWNHRSKSIFITPNKDLKTSICLAYIEEFIK